MKFIQILVSTDRVRLGNIQRVTQKAWALQYIYFRNIPCFRKGCSYPCHVGIKFTKYCGFFLGNPFLFIKRWPYWYFTHKNDFGSCQAKSHSVLQHGLISYRYIFSHISLSFSHQTYVRLEVYISHKLSDAYLGSLRTVGFFLEDFGEDQRWARGSFCIYDYFPLHY